MEEQVYFVIEQNELVLDKVLVEYNETPIFFVCKHAHRYFVASCIDIEQEEYAVVKVSLNKLSKMLHAKITMRDLILQADKFWDIVVGDNPEEDSVIEKRIDEIAMDALPYENAFLKIVTKDLIEYVERIDSILYDEGDWESEVALECTEYIEKLIKGQYEQYETIIQIDYRGAVGSTLKDFADICNYAGHNKEIYNSNMQVNVKSVEAGLALLENDKFPYAA